ncbi:hypothetical protein BDP55DRAFT_628199 [Colletotrichum godetiae]|uniref:Uncharacterized protein n=1 Tax=Colletotrichum godetiae TaxID=1209918 RepID=A0AAJ0AXA0_9PEZI|nr:uncharacterized protein BDP55DRAFT_628199 [Colletotrichum godetiae]KAK1690545.1 hypothetical protein BDP55DRAFT_628199 [Colletotrichum godetiae]
MTKIGRNGSLGSVTVSTLQENVGSWAKIRDKNHQELHQSYKPRVNLMYVNFSRTLPSLFGQSFLNYDAHDYSSFARRAQGSESECQSTSIRYLPFTFETFRYISLKFLIHSGISRVISRADVAAFCAGEVNMGELGDSTIVYHCRTSNAWPGDLALTVSHILKTGSTNAIFFGTDAEIEEEIIDRLYFSSQALQHPFLLQGIFTELERKRQLKRLVEDTQDELERAISNLSSESVTQSTKASTQPTIDLWLETTELRNGLMNWKTQLKEMLLHIEEMAETYPVPRVAGRPSAFDIVDAEADMMRKQAKLNSTIKSRLRSIIHEYEETIRDCTMRLDGMSMATQLSHAKTNMQIALETKRDGKRIQNISIFSMIFLPSMFVARSDTWWILPNVHTSDVPSYRTPEVTEVVVDGLV